jgi:hypothetical protein
MIAENALLAVIGKEKPSAGLIHGQNAHSGDLSRTLASRSKGGYVRESVFIEDMYLQIRRIMVGDEHVFIHCIQAGQRTYKDIARVDRLNFVVNVDNVAAVVLALFYCRVTGAAQANGY